MARVLTLFNRPRSERFAAAEAGCCPDELLYGTRTLRARGWDVVTTDLGFGSYFGGRLLKGVDNALSRGGRRTGFHLKQAWRVRRLCREVDLIFATADSSGLPVLFLQALGLFDTPVVYSSIGLAETFGEPAGVIYWMYRKLLLRARRILVYAEAEAAALTRVFHLPPGLVRFVPFGVETDFFAATPPGPGAPLAFGLDHRRDWPALFAAAAELETELDVVTNPDLVRGLAVPRNVRLHASEPVDALRERLRRAPFVILPVRENNYSGGTISLLQSMAAGRAVIVSQTQAITGGYGLRDDENCLLVPPGDVPALARAMTRLSREPTTAARLGGAAARHVREHLDIQQWATTVEETWREALA